MLEAIKTTELLTQGHGNRCEPFCTSDYNDNTMVSLFIQVCRWIISSFKSALLSWRTLVEPHMGDPMAGGSSVEKRWRRQ